MHCNIFINITHMCLVALPKGQRFKQSNISAANQVPANRVTRSKVTSPSFKPRTDELLPVCLICGKTQQKLNNVENADFETNMHKFTNWRDDHLLMKMSTGDFVCKEVKYHAVCCTEYQMSTEATYKGKQWKHSQKEIAIAKGETFETKHLW